MIYKDKIENLTNCYKHKTYEKVKDKICKLY